MTSFGPVLVRDEAVVTRIHCEYEDIQRVTARSLRTGTEHKVVVYLALTGAVKPGDSILINTAAVQLALGTGGADFAVCTGHTSTTSVPPGHIMKLRYTPQQLPVLACEAQESPHHELMQKAVGLDDTPVVAVELHSQIAAICHGIANTAPTEARVVFVMTDQAALPLAFSDLVRNLREEGLLAGTVTCGQAFGGDLEAVSLFSGLLAAKAILGAQFIIVGPGPGNVGTDTPYGFSAIDQGVALNAAASLGGTSVMCLRAGSEDARARHNGISHHSLTVLSRVLLAPANIPVPHNYEEDSLRTTLNSAIVAHRLIPVDVEHLWETYLQRHPNIKSMGRSPQQEPLLFKCALAAGAWSASTSVERAVT